MKKKRMINTRTVGILTDFTFHPYWEDCTHNDYVVIPSSALRFQAHRKGFSDDQNCILERNCSGKVSNAFAGFIRIEKRKT